MPQDLKQYKGIHLRKIKSQDKPDTLQQRVSDQTRETEKAN